MDVLWETSVGDCERTDMKWEHVWWGCKFWGVVCHVVAEQCIKSGRYRSRASVNVL